MFKLNCTHERAGVARAKVRMVALRKDVENILDKGWIEKVMTV